ncbi:hypothetical protein HK414_04485 [Ramlibacter terrae]|uniref:Uncharacterized protein n=1 Tax=Ramlibacter terrae TaxID=2732511 RepID=A0ABX6P0K6_9BURK|nr:hypothetical protein HK414_04485 [Ramlibacter terrae]
MDTENQWIDGWSVAGDDRIVGTVHGRPGQASGRTIITSPVVQVRFMGEWKTPVAFTESGSAYWLRDPAARYGLDAAEAFVWRLSRRNGRRSPRRSATTNTRSSCSRWKARPSGPANGSRREWRPCVSFRAAAWRSTASGSPASKTSSCWN